MPLAILGYIAAGASLYSGYKSSKSLKKGGDLARDAAYANAADLRDMAHSNYAAYLEAGSVNANAIRTVGEANALAIERQTGRNMLMYGIQSDEDRRRHLIQEKVTAGMIRAQASGTGVQVNTGSPLHYLNAQVDLGIRERRFGDLKAYWTLRNMYEEGTDRAHVTRLTAEQQAGVVEYNAALNAEISLAESLRQADAMERSGELQHETAGHQASAAMWGGITNAISSFGSFYGRFGGLNEAGTTGAYSFTGSAFNMGPSTYSTQWGSNITLG